MPEPSQPVPVTHTSGSTRAGDPVSVPAMLESAGALELGPPCPPPHRVPKLALTRAGDRVRGYRAGAAPPASLSHGAGTHSRPGLGACRAPGYRRPLTRGEAT